MDLIGKRYIFLGLSVTLVLVGVLAVSIFGFKQGIDFAGGTLWSLSFEPAPQEETLRQFFSNDLKHEAVITRESGGSFLVRLQTLNEEDHQKFLLSIKDKFSGANELSFQSIGSVVGSELRRSAILAIVFVLLAISLYIAFAFRKVSRPVSSWKYGLVTLVTLLHDIAIPAGLFAIFSRYLGVEVDTNFVVALLVIMGFSVHDTIVVFDRIRENLLFSKNRDDLSAVVNQSVNETFARSVNTSLTLVIVLIGIYVLGPVTLKYFILTILVGVLAGVYSSIFVASPLLTVAHDFALRGKKVGK
jgi:preprotein translocase subunit SecF